MHTHSIRLETFQGRSAEEIFELMERPLHENLFIPSFIDQARPVQGRLKQNSLTPVRLALGHFTFTMHSPIGPFNEGGVRFPRRASLGSPIPVGLCSSDVLHSISSCEPIAWCHDSLSTGLNDGKGSALCKFIEDCLSKSISYGPE